MTPERRHAFRRWLRRTVWLLVAVWAAYLLAMNIFIRTNLFRSLISADPASLLVEYSSAYSLVPGHIRVRDLRIRGRDSNIEWLLVIDRCQFRVLFSDLLHRRFHADNVQGDGLSLRVRQREPSFGADSAAALPPVPGFSDPPYSGLTPPPITDAEYNLWSIWLEDVVADHVREIWIDTVRYSGDLRIRGRWYFKPVRWLDVGPATVDVRRLTVLRGESEWVSDAAGQFVVTLHPGDVRDYEGGKVLDDLSVDGAILGRVHPGAIANRAGRLVGLEVLGAEAILGTRVVLDHGVLSRGTWLELGAPDVSARAKGLDLQAALDLRATVDDHDVGELTTDVRDLRVEQEGGARGAVTRLRVVLTSQQLDLASPFGDATFTADVTGARTGSLRAWLRDVPLAQRLDIESRAVSADAHLAGVVKQGTASGRLRIEADGLRAALLPGNGRCSGDITANIAFDASLRERRVDVSGSQLALRDVRMKMQGVTVAAASSLAVRAVRARVVAGTVTGDLRIEVPEVQLPALSVLANAVALPSGIEVQGGSALARGAANVDLGSGTIMGEATMTSPRIRVRIGAQAFDGELALVLRARRLGPVTDLSGSQVSFHDSRPDGWWGRVDAPQAALGTSSGVRLRAHVRASAKDASPIAALIDSHATDAAKLALGLVPSSDLRATADLLLAPSLLAVQSATAQASGFGLALEAAKVGSERSVAMSLAVGPVHAGIDVTSRGTSVMLAGVDAWFAERVAAMRAAEQQYE
jgi:hypothetical protein